MRLGYAFVITTLVAAGAIGQAQAPAPDTRPTAQERDNDFDWGWLGLLGLAGLFGLKRHDTAHVNDRVATAHR